MRMLRTTVFAAAALAAGGAGAEGALVTFQVLAPDTALKLAVAARDDCRARGYQVAVAVVDRFGVVQVLLRDRLAGAHTPETARRKAWTAVSFRTDTQEMSAATTAGQEASGVRHVEGALMVGGGIPVTAAGTMVGGIGVSGAPAGAEDDACARAGLDAIEDDLNF